MYLINLLILLLFYLLEINAEMHCLVTRPGYGLITEICPLHTVACRIRIEKDAVSFYEYSLLYDRNQFVCVLNGEFGKQKSSGCVKKRSGHIRCWCFGRSNCNTPENSKLLYETFIEGDEKKFQIAVANVDFSDLKEENNEEDLNNNNNLIKNENKTTILIPLKNADNNKEEENEGKNFLKLENTIYESSDRKKFMAAKTVYQKQQNSQQNVNLLSSKLENEKEEESLKFTKQKQQFTTTTTKTPTKTTTIIKELNYLNKNKTKLLSSSLKTTKTTTLSPQTTKIIKSIYDNQNKVHIINVSGRDHYNTNTNNTNNNNLLPVEQILSSSAIKRIIEEERQKLKFKAEDNSAEEEEEENDELLDEDEELLEDWEYQENFNRTKITERRSSSLSNTKISQNSPKKFIKSRLEQNERLSSTKSSYLLEDDDNFDEEEELLKNLSDGGGEEYFDSAFFSPSSSSSSGLFERNFIFLFFSLFLLFNNLVFSLN